MREKILVADDELYVLDVCKRILEHRYEVKIVHSGLEAIQLAADEHFDLLLTDIKMPGIDGLETAREIKKIHPDIMCITMTGFSTMETAIKALRLGVDEFVIKPFAPEELTLAIDRAFEKERLRQENIRLKSLMPLFEFNKLLMSSTDIDAILSQVVTLAMAELQATSATLYVVDDFGNFVRHQQRNISASQLRIIEDRGLAIATEASESPQLVTQALPRNPEIKEILIALGFNAAVAVPIVGQGKQLGMMLLFKKQGQFSQSQLNFLGVLAGQAAVAYENAKLFSNLQQAYDQLKSLDHLKSEFINVAAHELRTPLAILMGYASVASEEVEGVQKDYMDSIVRNAIRLQHLIDDLLNMRYIESGEMSFVYELTNITDVVTLAIDDMEMLARKKHINISMDMPPDIPEFYADAQRMELVLLNLIGNAIKFTPPSGKIHITCAVKDRHLQLSVADTGIGIPKTEYSKIFDRFYQIESSLNRHHEGIGLGLSIVKGIVESSGGKVWVDSAEGKGSTFTVALPMYTSRPKQSNNGTK